MSGEASGVAGRGEGCSLPVADFLSDEEDEVDPPGGVAEDGIEVGVFSRYDHIRSLGLYSEGNDLDQELDLLEDLEPNPEEEHYLWNGDEQGDHLVQQGRAIDSAISNDSVRSGMENSWNDFKSEFSDILKVSEEKIESGEIHTQENSNTNACNDDARQNFLIEMIKAIHDSREPPSLEECATDGAAGVERSQQPCEEENGVASKPSQSSPTKPRKQLLSLSTLETIHESDLDRLLESVDSAISDDGGNTQFFGNDEVFNQTDSDVASPTSPPNPPKSWGIKDSSSDSASEDLMRQLQQLSLSQSRGRGGGRGGRGMGYDSGMGESAAENVPETESKHEPRTGGWRSEKPEPATVRIDLRPQRNAENVPAARERNGGNVPATSLSQESQQHSVDSEDSDSEDDAFSWAQQRRLIKRDLNFSASGRLSDFSHTSSSSHHTSISRPNQRTHQVYTSTLTSHTLSVDSTLSSTTTNQIPSSTPDHASPSSTDHTPSSTGHTSSSFANSTPSSSSLSNSHTTNGHTSSSNCATFSATTMTNHSVPPPSTNHTPLLCPDHALSSSFASVNYTSSTVRSYHNLHKTHKMSTSTDTEIIEKKELDSISQADKDDTGQTGQERTGQAGQASFGTQGSSRTSDHSQSDKSGRMKLTLPQTIDIPDHSPPVHRQRSSDSLTLSSSYSDGDEVISSEGTNCSGDGKTKPTKPSGVPGTGKKSKKQSKKSKKSRKKEEVSTKKKSTERSLASQRRRAHVLQRIRQDSLNTSSDEENLLSPGLPPDANDSGGVVETSSTTSLSSEKELSSADREALKMSLQKRIFSKKPPAYFETPATDPIFHEEVSFEKLLSDSNPAVGSKGLLILPLSQYGLSGSVAFPELDMDSQLVLHCLLLTWLVCQAAADCCRVQGAWDDEGSMEAGFSLSFTLPFRITGMQQTVLDGHPSLLIAVRLNEALSSNNSDSNELNSMDTFLSGVTLKEFLQPLLAIEPISNSIPSRCLGDLDGTLLHPLNALFSFQTDVSPLTTPVSFYWHSLYHLSALPSFESLKATCRVSTTVCILNSKALFNANVVFSVFQKVFSSGLDVAGLRLLFGDEDGTVSSLFKSQHSSPPNKAVSLALALRGTNAVYRWVDVVGPEDSALAKVTDPNSISAEFGSGLVQAIRTPYQLSAALAKWFGGRACLKTGTVIGMSDPHTKSERRKRQRVRFSESESEDSISISSPLPDVTFPPLISNRPRLIVQPYSKSLLVVSPSVPPSCYATVLESCSELGFDIFGAKRMRLNTKRANVLEIPFEFLSQFTPSSTPPSPLILDSTLQPPLLGGVATSLQAPPPLPSVIVIVGRENSSVHSTALRKLIASKVQQVMSSNQHIMKIRESLSSISHMLAYSEDKLKVLGNFTAPVSNSNVQPKLGSVKADDSEELREELCFIAMPGAESLPTCVSMLNRIFNVSVLDPSDVFLSHSSPKQHEHTFTGSDQDVPNNDEATYGKFEMVGIKIIPQLSRFHAKKLCPLQPDDSHYPQAVQLLSDKPATIVVLRGICCNKRMARCLKSCHTPSRVLNLEQKLQYIVSRDPLEGVNLSQLFFSGKDLYSDNSSRVLSSYLPDAWIHEADILHTFMHPQESLFSVLQLPLTQMTLAVKVFNKVSRSGFAFAGIELSEACSNQGGVEEVSLAVCVERVNAVWVLQHLIQPFTKERQERKLKCSGNFTLAISDVKKLFPDGVYAIERGTVVKDYGIKCLPEDQFNNLSLSVESVKKLRSISPSIGIASPLMERTLLVLPPSLLTQQPSGGSVCGFVHVLDFLWQSKFQICGMKMVLLSSASAQEIKLTLSLDFEAEVLTCSPSLLVVVERDNAASCFQLIAKSAFHGQGDCGRAVSAIIAPDNLKQANHLLSFFHADF